MVDKPRRCICGNPANRTCPIHGRPENEDYGCVKCGYPEIQHGQKLVGVCSEYERYIRPESEWSNDDPETRVKEITDDLARPESEERWEVERDRFGVLFSGPLEIGECIVVVPEQRVRKLEKRLKREVESGDDAVKLAVKERDRALAALSELLKAIDSNNRGLGVSDSEEMVKAVREARSLLAS